MAVLSVLAMAAYFLGLGLALGGLTISLGGHLEHMLRRLQQGDNVRVALGPLPSFVHQQRRNQHELRGLKPVQRRLVVQDRGDDIVREQGHGIIEARLFGRRGQSVEE